MPIQQLEIKHPVVLTPLYPRDDQIREAWLKQYQILTSTMRTKKLRRQKHRDEHDWNPYK